MVGKGVLWGPGMRDEGAAVSVLKGLTFTGEKDKQTDVSCMV